MGFNTFITRAKKDGLLGTAGADDAAGLTGVAAAGDDALPELGSILYLCIVHRQVTGVKKGKKGNHAQEMK